MYNTMQIVALYVAANALIMLVLGIMVVRARIKTRTVIGDAGKPEMIAAQRAHANNAEYVPMALLLLITVQVLGGSPGLLHAIGGTLTIGRLLHGFGLSRSTGVSQPRFWGTNFTWASFAIGIVGVFWQAFFA